MRIDDLATKAGADTRAAARRAVDVEAALLAVTAGPTHGRGRAIAAVVLAVAVAAGGVLTVQLLQGDGSTQQLPAPAAPTGTLSATPRPTNSPTPVEKYSSLADARFVELASGKYAYLPKSIRSISSVQNFEVSPDGEQLAFYGGGNIYVVGVDGSSPRKICSAAPYSAPSWAPDGESLAFGEGHALRVVDISTGVVRRITTGEHPIYVPDFSADGSTILFTMQHNSAFALWTIPEQGGDPVLLVDRAAFGTYSPDGQSIAFRRTDFGDGDVTEMSDSAVWVAGSDGQRPHRISPATAWMSQISSSALWPAWSPDGSRIAYQPLMGRPIEVLDVSTGHVRTVGTGTKVDWLDDDTLIVEDVALTPG